MSDELNRVKKTIADILRLAEDDAATEGEVENAIRFATKLMMQHQLTREDIEQNPGIDKERPIKMNKTVVGGNASRLSTWERSLGGVVTNIVGSVGYYIDNEYKFCGQYDTNGNPIKQRGVVFYGPEEDVIVAKEIYLNLCKIIAAMGRLRYGTALRGNGRIYGDGFVAGLYEKYKRAVQAITHETSTSSGTSLVVRSTAIAKQTQEDAKKWLKDAHGIKLTTRPASSASFDGRIYDRGKKDGRNTNVDVNSHRRKRLQ